jgi:uncharacterized protein YdbL (DUF1318 family)
MILIISKEGKMVRKVFISLAAIVILVGCAKVQVMAPKDPIKLDIAMRLDVYQHVEKDIDAIENMISGSQDAGKPQSLLDCFIGVAYAEEGLPPQVQEAATNRKARYQDLMKAEAAGQVGENKSGFVELRASGQGNVSLQELVSAENNDRKVIYKSIAEKNGASFDEVQKLYAKKLQTSAPAGAFVQSDSGEWKTK